MLTVKNTFWNGDEDIVEVERVFFVEKESYEGARATNMQYHGKVFAWKKGVDEPITPFEKGTIYVMNDNGKTVAVYHLETQS